MKNIFKAAGIVLAAALVFAFAACKGDAGLPGQNAEYIEVEFFLNGGTIIDQYGIPHVGTIKYRVIKGGRIDPLLHDPFLAEVDSSTALEPGLHRLTDEGEDSKISQTFDGWWWDDETRWWNFYYDVAPQKDKIILKAIFSPAAVINEVGADDLAGAIKYANDNPGSYRYIMMGEDNHDNPGELSQTLTLTGNGGVTLNSGVHLEIIGNTTIRPGVEGDPEGIPPREPVAELYATKVTISRSNAGILFNITGADRSLTIGKNVILKGLSANSNSLVRVADGGKFVMDEGSLITGNTMNAATTPYSYGASAVYITNNGEFHMKGGEISGNTSNWGYYTSTVNLGTSGGGPAGGKFIMETGAVIKDNKHINSGYQYTGTVNIQQGTFEMRGGEITGNSRGTTAYMGRPAGGVFVGNSNAALFQMKGGVINNNTGMVNGTNNAHHDVFVYSTAAALIGRIELSGKITIGKLTIGAETAAIQPFIGITGALDTDTTIGLNLWGDGTLTTAIGYWTGATALAVTRGLVQGSGYMLQTPGDLERFTLGNFYSYSDDLTIATNSRSIGSATGASVTNYELYYQGGNFIMRAK